MASGDISLENHKEKEHGTTTFSCPQGCIYIIQFMYKSCGRMFLVPLKGALSSLRLYSIVHWTSHFLQVPEKHGHVLFIWSGCWLDTDLLTTKSFSKKITRILLPFFTNSNIGQLVNTVHLYTVSQWILLFQRVRKAR